MHIDQDKKSKSERVYLELPRSRVKVNNTTENYNFFTKTIFLGEI